MCGCGGVCDAYVMLCYAILCSAMPCNAMSCHAMLGRTAVAVEYEYAVHEMGEHSNPFGRV